MNDLILTKKRKELLDKLGINNIDDLMSFYPMRYEVNRLMKYEEFKLDDRVCFLGKFVSQNRSFKIGRLVVNNFQAMIDDEIIKVVIYNRPWLKFDENKPILIVGKYIAHNKVQATNTTQTVVAGKSLGIIPFYHLKEGISQNDIRNIFIKNKKVLLEQANDIIPNQYLLKHKLCNKKQAIAGIHFPNSSDELKKSLAYLKYEEFLKFYLTLLINKKSYVQKNKEAKIFSKTDIDDFVVKLPFKLTDDQIKSVNEILLDLSSDKIMYRLLQGDVGSGKTIVASIALYANYLSGYQGVLMAPTEILAKQHFESFKSIFDKKINIEVLYSSIDNNKRQEIIDNLSNEKIDILIGTHALFQDQIDYANLGLIITDEQQRFGVKQRYKLKSKSKYSDFLLMSATPIPRTLASSIYGDMDISTIKEVPKERKGCITKVVYENSIVTIKDELFKRLNYNEQIYIVASAIEDNELKTKNVLSLYKHLSQLFKGYKVGYIHGKISSDEKDEIMNDFSNNKIQILISTTVIEVGVNVKNATTMVIYDADRFGLSQLHQLRGRVQRGNKKGYFYLLTSSKDVQVKKRLEVLSDSNDGFEIAYQDLIIRGPGDILGTRQSGLPSLILGNLFKDELIIEAAKKDAEEIIENPTNDNEKIITYLKDNFIDFHVD